MGKGLECDKPSTVQAGRPIKCFGAWSLCSVHTKKWRLHAFNVMPVFLVIISSIRLFPLRKEHMGILSPRHSLLGELLFVMLMELCTKTQ